ncbi:aryl-alcohol dehydrogenase [Hyphodiscus hymeniophilus]|uniref:Aryl-alcohol dehydrogenase n=1 Tax=Hyphodiscus hymeniophilus TaxID=353542 RepID=A0A9P6VMS7_9HELO|nr:aryl-alcohol dehydrogenase [Hyphodiscus hymeniophilus]
MTNMMKYTHLGQSGLKISRICVGCMSFGDRRGRLGWLTEEKDALPILNACFEAGINFYDTANTYSNGVSEKILGKAIKQYQWPRENIVIATKLFFPVGHIKDGKLDSATVMSEDERDRSGYLNSYGLSRKHIFDSVDASLKRLQLDYIDLLQIHRFDPDTPVKETMKALHDIVESGKVRYIGASSMWAHQLLEMQYTARLNGWTEFISMQNLHNAAYREEEKEMVPSLKKFGMGMIPWSPVAMGYLTRPHDKFVETERGSSMSGTFMGNEYTTADQKINKQIQEIAEKRGTSMAIVAIAWSLSKPFITAPIIGMGKVERVKEAVEAVNFELTKEELESIDTLHSPFFSAAFNGNFLEGQTQIMFLEDVSRIIFDLFVQWLYTRTIPQTTRTSLKNLSALIDIADRVLMLGLGKHAYDLLNTYILADIVNEHAIENLLDLVGYMYARPENGKHGLKQHLAGLIARDSVGCESCDQMKWGLFEQWMWRAPREMVADVLGWLEFLQQERMKDLESFTNAAGWSRCPPSLLAEYLTKERVWQGLMRKIDRANYRQSKSSTDIIIDSRHNYSVVRHQ